MSGSAGGAATNAGIDFQQRISALFMTHMLMDVAFIDDFGMKKNAKVQSLQFESDEAIDDVVIGTDLGAIFIQAKRSISCSQVISSEFSKVIKQFVDQYFRGVSDGDQFVLATSSKASSKITRDLRKITESIKLNDTGFRQNPLNKSEKAVYAIFNDLISFHYLHFFEKEITENTKIDIFKRIHISVIDIEAGMPLEKAIVTLISGRSIISAELLWSTLISLGLSLSKERASINKQGLEDRLGRFLGESTLSDENTNEQLQVEIKESVCSGREVLVIESFEESVDYMIVELIRFKDDGSKKLKFYDNKAELLDGNTWNILYRAATYAGAERYLEREKKFFEDKKMAVLPINSEEDFDKVPVSLSHSEFCQNIFLKKANKLNCVICSDPISEDQSPYIEIDELGIAHDVGFAHDECLSPINRVLGLMDCSLFRENPNIKNFDYEAWYCLHARGQGLFAGLSNMPKDIYPIAWNSNSRHISRSKYCIKINLEDGSSRYVHERGRVVRESKVGAEDKCEMLNSMFKSSLDNKDPVCYTSKNEMFTTYSVAIKNKDNDEECIVCVNSEVVAFTNAINKAYSAYDNFYSPLVMFLEKESGLPLVLDETLCLLSSPLDFERYLNNWKKGEIEMPDYTLSIIESDIVFDRLVSDFKSDGITIVIDPEVDMNGQMVSGLVVQSMDEMLQAAK